MRFRLAQGPRAGREGEQVQGSKPMALLLLGHLMPASGAGGEGRQGGAELFSPSHSASPVNICSFQAVFTERLPQHPHHSFCVHSFNLTTLHFHTEKPAALLSPLYR